MNAYNYFFASTYGSGSYDSSTYNGAASTTTGTTTTTPSTGVLTNTGFDIALAVTVACVLVFVAVIVRVWRRSVPVKQEIDSRD